MEELKARPQRRRTGDRPGFTAEDIARAEERGRIEERGRAQERELLAITLREINRRLDEANGLKAAMVTKEDFKAFQNALAQNLQQFVTVEALGEGEIWVREGVPHGLSETQAEALVDMANEQLQRRKEQGSRDRWWKTVEGRVGLVAATAVLLDRLGPVLFETLKHVRIH